MDLMSATQEWRDAMAKKRSKRASKTTTAKSKRRGKARAAPAQAKPKGVINAWEQDPGNGAQPSGGQVIQRPVPVLREQPFSIRIVNPASAPEAKPHSPGTADFRYWTAAEALRRGADFWGSFAAGNLLGSRRHTARGSRFRHRSQRLLRPPGLEVFPWFGRGKNGLLR